MIECKTLYGLCVPHTAFPNANWLQQLQLKQQQEQTTNQHRVHVTKEVIRILKQHLMAIVAEYICVIVLLTESYFVADTIAC